jgi:ABC-type uncharacterized transport system substrate-binding protein
MKYFCVFLSYIVPFISFAHPHVFIDNRIGVVFNERGLEGFNHEWTFDEMFSSTIIQEFDLNADGKFNEDEIKEVKKGAFSNLKEYDYFTEIEVNGQQFEIQGINNFYAEIDSGVMIYEFFMPCEVVATSESQEVKIAVFDPTYFVQVLLTPKETFRFIDTLNVGFNYEVFDDEENSYYYGQIIPEALKVKFKKKL